MSALFRRGRSPALVNRPLLELERYERARRRRHLPALLLLLSLLAFLLVMHVYD